MANAMKERRPINLNAVRENLDIILDVFNIELFPIRR
jgi:hypothetical protein